MSNQEREATRLIGDQSNLQKSLMSGKYNVQNRFNAGTDPFGYNDINQKLDDIFGGYESKINRDALSTTANEQQKAAASLASRGITGGSVLSDTQSGIASGINKNKANALSELGTSRATSMKDLMEYINEMNLRRNQLATNVDLGNVENMLGGVRSSTALQSGLLGSLDDTTAWDDIFGVIKTGVGAIPAINTIFGKKNTEGG